MKAQLITFVQLPILLVVNLTIRSYQAIRRQFRLQTKNAKIIHFLFAGLKNY